MENKCSEKNILEKRVGRPPKKKRGRPRRIMFPALPKPPQIKLSEGCSVSGCINARPSKGMWMFTLPEADDLKDRWLEFLNQPNHIADHRDVRVCEVHFKSHMWKKTRDGERVLRPDAMPTLSGTESRDEANDNLNFVDMIEFEEPDDIIESELLEPEIDMLEESECNLPYYTTEKKRKPQDTPENTEMDIKRNPTKYAAHLKRKRLKQPHSVEDDVLKNEDVDMHDLMVQFQAKEFSSHVPELKVEPFYPTEEESIVPDLFVPASCNVEETSNIKSENIESSIFTASNYNFEEVESPKGEYLEETTLNLPAEKGYDCPFCKKHLKEKITLRHHLEKVHPSDETAQRLALDLKTRLRFQKRQVILNEWCELFPEMASEISSFPSKLSSTANGSDTEANPAKNRLKKVFTVPRQNGQVLNSYELWKEQRKKVANSTLNSKPVKSQVEDPNTYDPLGTEKHNLNVTIKNASSYMFCASLKSVPSVKRLVLKQKLMEMVNLVVKQNIDPEKIIIARKP